MWRVVTSDRIQASLKEVEQDWTLCDLLSAHDMLDMYEAITAKPKGG